jgi:hypothetical protein
MPSVMDAPARVDHDNHDFQEAQPQAPMVHRWFWYTVLQYVRRPRVPSSSHTPSSSHVALLQLELPMARLAQEYPTLYLLGFCGIHSG